MIDRVANEPDNPSAEQRLERFARAVLREGVLLERHLATYAGLYSFCAEGPHRKMRVFYTGVPRFRVIYTRNEPYLVVRGEGGCKRSALVLRNVARFYAFTVQHRRMEMRYWLVAYRVSTLCGVVYPRAVLAAEDATFRSRVELLYAAFHPTVFARRAIKVRGALY